MRSELLFKVVPLPYPVQQIQENVGEDWTNHSTLWCAFVAAFNVPLRSIFICLYDRRFQPHLYNVQYLPIADAFGYGGKEIGIRYCVKILGNVCVDDLGIAISHELRDIIQRIVR